MTLEEFVGRAQAAQRAVDKVSFDVKMAERLREEGIEFAANARPGALANAQAVARYLGQRRTFVTMDDVWLYLMERGYKGDELGNAAGAVFPNSEWRLVGYTKSVRTKAHRRVIGKWQLWSLGETIG